MRYCLACVKRTKRLRCGLCGRPTVPHRRHVEWAVLCHLAELEPDQYQTAAGLFVLGDGISRQEFTHILNGLKRAGHVHVERRWNGPRYYRVPGALIEFHFGGKK